MTTWTLSDLEAEIGRYIDANVGAQAHTGTSLRALIGRALREFARTVKCWYVTDGTYTGVTGSVDISETAISGQYLFSIDRVRIPSQSSVLQSVDAAWMRATQGAWEDSSNGVPGYWFMEDDKTLRIYPSSASGLSIHVAGHCYPAKITAASADADEISFPDDTDTAFIDLCLAYILTPVAEGVGAASRGRAMAEAQALMKELARRYWMIPPSKAQNIRPPQVTILQ